MNEIDTLQQLLNSDLSQEQTDYPVISGLFEFRFDSPKMENTKSNDGNKNLTFKAILVTPGVKDRSGKDVNPGYVVFERIYIPLTNTGDAEKFKTAQTMSRQKLAGLKRAITGSQAGGFGDPAQYQGQTFLAQVGISNDPNYGERSEIKRYVARG